MAVTVFGARIIVDGGVARCDAATELFMSGIDPRIEHVGLHAHTGVFVVVDIVESGLSLVDLIEPPRWPKPIVIGECLRGECTGSSWYEDGSQEHRDDCKCDEFWSVQHLGGGESEAIHRGQG